VTSTAASSAVASLFDARTVLPQRTEHVFEPSAVPAFSNVLRKALDTPQPDDRAARETPRTDPRPQPAPRHGIAARGQGRPTPEPIDSTRAADELARAETDTDPAALDEIDEIDDDAEHHRSATAGMEELPDGPAPTPGEAPRLPNWG
jgi:hypothetical protein